MNDIPAWAAWMIGGVVVVGLFVVALQTWAPGFLASFLPH